MHGISVKVNPENTDGTVSIRQPSGQILQPTAKSGLKAMNGFSIVDKFHYVIKLEFFKQPSSVSVNSIFG